MASSSVVAIFRRPRRKALALARAEERKRYDASFDEEKRATEAAALADRPPESAEEKPSKGTSTTPDTKRAARR